MATRGYSRTDRVGDELAQSIARALVSDSSDPRLAQVSVTAVRVTPDLGLARVYWVPLSGADDVDAARSLAKSLARARGFLRRHVARDVVLRRVPDIEFQYDESIAHGRKMEILIDAIGVSASDAAGGGEPASATRDGSDGERD